MEPTHSPKQTRQDDGLNLPGRSHDPRLSSTPNEAVNLPDGRTVWLSRSVAAIGIVLTYDRQADAHYVAVSRRGPGAPDHQGSLAICGGYVDWDETLQAAAIREIWEEVGLNLYEYSDRGEVDLPEQPYFIMSDPTGDARQNITVRFCFRLKCESLPALGNHNSEPGEVTEAFWLKLSKESLAAHTFAFNHRAILEEMLAGLVSENR